MFGSIRIKIESERGGCRRKGGGGPIGPPWSQQPLTNAAARARLFKVPELRTGALNVDTSKKIKCCRSSVKAVDSVLFESDSTPSRTGALWFFDTAQADVNTISLSVEDVPAITQGAQLRPGT